MSPSEILTPATFSTTQTLLNSKPASQRMNDDEILVDDARSRRSPAQAVESKLLRTAHRAEEYNRGTHLLRISGRASQVN